MLSLENVEKINTYSNNNNNNMTSVNAKQTAVNQAAQIAMNRGQFQPFYYYTANNGQNGPQSVQLHSYPNMMGMNPQLFAHPQFAYNFYQAQAQAQNAFYQQQNNSHNHAGSNNNNNTPSHHPHAKHAHPVKHHKGKVSNKNSDSNSSDHGLDLHHSKTSSGSEGTNSCDMDGKSTMNLNNSVLASEVGANTNQTKTNSPTKATKNKKKNKKPSKKVIVVDLPEDLQSIESVTNRCQQYGEILLVRVIKPGKILPYDLKMYTNKIHDLGTTTCAIIEFENSNGASKTVEMEDNNLKLTLLQHGAELQLYGNSDGKASSELGSHLESEHTHGESGIGERSSGTRSESTHSHEDSYTNNSVHDDSVHDENNNKTFTNKIQINKEIKLEKNNSTNNNINNNNNNAKNNIFRPSFLKNKSKNTISESESQSQKSSRSDSLKSSNLSSHGLINPPKLGLLGISPGKEFELDQNELEMFDNSTDISDSLDEYIIEEPKKITINNKSKIINTNNGRVTTALNIKLTVNKPSAFNRNVIKMDLAHPEQKQLNVNASDIFSNALPSSIGRSSPALLSDPSDDLLLKSRISSDSDSDDFEYRSYNRTFLYSLRECRRAQELPLGLPNIPELLPVARRM